MRELEYAVAVADTMNFSAAATNLGMAQPPLSRAIARLETRLGVALFVRTSRSVRLTPSGEEFIAGARRVLGSLDDLTIQTRLTNQERPLIIAVRAGSGDGAVAEALATWHGATVRVEISRTPVDILRRGLTDLAFACATDATAGLTVTGAGTWPSVALVSSDRARDVATMNQITAMAGYRDRCPEQSLDEISARVAFGGMVVVASADVIPRLGPNVAAIPILDAAATTYATFEKGHGTSAHPAAAEFGSHLRRTSLRLSEDTSSPMSSTKLPSGSAM